MKPYIQVFEKNYSRLFGKKISLNEQSHSNILGDSGKNLLILHGFLGMSDNWKTLARQWSQQGFRVHLIDQRNHGMSFWDTNFDYEVMADDLQCYIDEQRIQKCWVLGHSMGGKTAMYWACQHPEKLQGLVVVDIAPKEYPPHHQKLLNDYAPWIFLY